MTDTETAGPPCGRVRARWWTADLHLGHANIIAYTGRPYADLEEMHEGIISAWSSTVSDDDEVWVLGDVAMGGVLPYLPLIGRLAGHKVLVPGNHDGCWAGRSRVGGRSNEQWRALYLDAGFDEIRDGPVTTVVSGVEVTVDHFPYTGDSGEADRFSTHRPPDRGGWLLHGHVHTRWRQHGRQVNVGIDAWAGRPVSDGELGAIVSSGDRDLEPLPWGEAELSR